MKKSILTLLGAGLLLTSCQSDEPFAPVEGGEKQVTFTLNVPGELGTRAGTADNASDKGGWTNSQGKLSYTLVLKADNDVQTLTADAKDNQVVFNPTVVLGRNYTVTAYAYFGDTAKSTIDAIAESKGINDETKDAYTWTGNINFATDQDGTNQNITLKRPYAKLRLIATDYNAAKTDVRSVTVEYKNQMYTMFNAVEGQFNTEKSVSFTNQWSNSYYEAATTYGEKTIFADYVPVNEIGYAPFTVTVEYQNGETYTRTFAEDIPVRRNALTTLKGAFFTANSEIKVEVKDAFEGQPENINFVSVSTATQLQDAINNGGDGETIILTDDIVLTEPLVFGVNSGNPAPTRSGATNSFVLNLNGNDIIGTDTSTASYGLITIKNGAELTIEGNGTISLTAEQNRYWNAYSSVISNQPGGKLIVNGGTIQHLGGTDMAYAIDNLTNGKGTYAETIINGGTIKSTYRAIRQFLNGVEAQNILTVNGGTIESTEGNKAIWMQDPSKNANTGTLFVGADAKLKGNVYLTVTEGSTEWPVKAFITIDALKDGSKVELNDAAKAKVDGQITFAVSGADQLVGALENKHNVYLMNDIKIDPATMSNAYGTTGINVKYGQTIDGGGHTLNIQGAGGTWDSGINTTGGIIRNLTVTGSFRGIFINHNSSYSEKVVLENVTITGTTYTISCDQGLYQGIEATNCTFNGWTSYAATLGSAKFLNCSFGEGNGYKYCRPYCSTEFVECTFCPGYAVDTTQAEVKFTDCTWEE